MAWIYNGLFLEIKTSTYKFNTLCMLFLVGVTFSQPLLWLCLSFHIIAINPCFVSCNNGVHEVFVSIGVIKQLLADVDMIFFFRHDAYQVFQLKFCSTANWCWLPQQPPTQSNHNLHELLNKQHWRFNCLLMLKVVPIFNHLLLIFCLIENA